MALTGFGVSFLQAARAAALENTVSWATPGERVLHGGLIKATSLYLSARQWLEAYADTHSEWSPMDGRAYLPAGRKGFYYYHYRTDMMERHGVSEEQLADARARAQASRASGRQPGSKRRRQMSANPLEDVPIADAPTLLRAWRVECPWLVVCKSISMFTR